MDKLYIAKMMMHRWEEEPISGIQRGYKGTFAIFLYGCNMHCVFCQNKKISQVSVLDTINKCEYKEGLYVDNVVLSCEELAKRMLEAEKDGAASISFITGVWYRKLIIETITIAKRKGLKLPIVYNSSGYEIKEHIKELDGLVDIYLPDFKYFDNIVSKKYSDVSDYVETAKDCIDEMYRQVGKHNFDDAYQKKYRGVIVRHLVLPSYTNDSMKIIKYLYEKYGNNVYLSIMSQYTPVLTEDNKIKYKELDRKITKKEYDKVVDYALSLGITSAYIQEGDVAKESFIPDF